MSSPDLNQAPGISAADLCSAHRFKNWVLSPVPAKHWLLRAFPSRNVLEGTDAGLATSTPSCGRPSEGDGGRGRVPPAEQRPQTSLEGVPSGTNCLRSEREFSFLELRQVWWLWAKVGCLSTCSVWGPLHAGLPVSTMSSSQTVCGVGKWGGSAVSFLPNLCLYRFVCGLGLPTPKAHQESKTSPPRPTTKVNKLSTPAGVLQPSWQRAAEWCQEPGSSWALPPELRLSSQDKIFRWHPPATTAWSGMQGGRHCFRGQALAPPSATPTPRLMRAQQTSTPGWRPHTSRAVVLLTPRPTLHLLCLRPGCILRHSWTSLALSHRAPALDMQVAHKVHPGWPTLSRS